MATTKLNITQLTASQIISFAQSGFFPDEGGYINLTTTPNANPDPENKPKKSICEVFFENEDDYKKLMQVGGIRAVTVSAYVSAILTHTA